MKKNILKIIKTKNKRPLVCLTAYSKPIAKILDRYCDIVLVGDSMATAMYGMKNTHQATLEMMIEHGISVVKESNADAVAIANVLHYKTLNISEIRSSFQRAEINVREYEKS